MNANEIRDLIAAALPGAVVELHDLAGDNNHFRAIVTSPAFAGKSRVAQHQMVYAALGAKMGNELHALAVETKIPT
jgi:stress-induced morphogen